MDIIFNYLKDKIIGGAGDVIVFMTQASINLLQNEIVKNVLDLFEYIGWLILVIGVLFAIANLYIRFLETGRLELHFFIINVTQSIIAIFFLRVGATEIFILGNTLNKLICKVTSEPDYNKSINSFVDYLVTMRFNTIWILFIGLVAIISIMVSLFQIMKRGGMYIAQIAMGYIYLFSLPAGNTDGFSEWIKQTVAIALTNVLQTTLLFVGMNLMAREGKDIILGLGVILGASSVEKIAGRYGMSTSISRSIRGFTSTIGMNLGRLIFK